MRRHLTNLPLRLRVAAAFAAAMAIVIATSGVFVYQRIASDLDDALRRELQVRAADLSTVVVAGAATLARSSPPGQEPGESFAQLLDRDSHVLDATAGLGQRSLVPAETIARALSGATAFVDVPRVPSLDERARLFVLPGVSGSSAIPTPPGTVVGIALRPKQL